MTELAKQFLAVIISNTVVLHFHNITWRRGVLGLGKGGIRDLDSCRNCIRPRRPSSTTGVLIGVLTGFLTGVLTGVLLLGRILGRCSVLGADIRATAMAFIQGLLVLLGLLLLFPLDLDLHAFYAMCNGGSDTGS